MIIIIVAGCTRAEGTSVQSINIMQLADSQAPKYVSQLLGSWECDHVPLPTSPGTLAVGVSRGWHFLRLPSPLTWMWCSALKLACSWYQLLVQSTVDRCTSWGLPVGFGAPTPLSRGRRDIRAPLPLRSRVARLALPSPRSFLRLHEIVAAAGVKPSSIERP